MDNQKKKYEEVLQAAAENSAVLGVFLGGSRGKSEEFVTKDSDMDVYVIVGDDASKQLKEEFEKYNSGDFELWVHSLSQFKNYAAWGSEREWERYNLTHNNAVIDKTGQIQKLLDEKGGIPQDKQKEVIENALDDYINQVYRSAKYYRDGNTLAAYLDATESLPYLMTALYALEGRIKPYNKYFEWELRKYPLKVLPWPPKDFIKDYLHVLKTGDIKTQGKIYRAIKKLFINKGYNKVFNEWKGKYFVG